jgi:hypothetical protein
MTPFIIRAKQRLQHFSSLQEKTNKGEKSIFVTLLTLMIRGLEQQPLNFIWQTDVLQTFLNMNNSSFYQVNWSQLEWNQFRAELHQISEYLYPEREE